jgi:C1A family cysteine protease
MTVVGYDIPKQQLLVKNSFGKDWGDNGYGWIPFTYFEKEGDENWVFDISNQPDK